MSTPANVQSKIQQLKDRIADLEAWFVEGQPCAEAIQHHAEVVTCTASALEREIDRAFPYINTSGADA